MTTGAAAICFACDRWAGGRCSAFPQGIPDAIMFGGFDHREPFGGEVEGRLFVLEPGEEDSLRAYENIMEIARAL